MKKILMLIAIMAMTVAHAQHGGKGERGERMKNVTPQDMATMQSKKMTLALDLNDQQEKEVYQVLLNTAEKRKANKLTREERDKLTEEQKKAQRVAMMDERIAVKRAMKKILNKEQYAKWEKMMLMRKRQGEKRNKNRRDRF